MLLPAEDGDVIAVAELISCLLQRERSIVLPLAEAGSAVTAAAALLLRFEESLVGTLDAFGDILYGLGAYRTPVLTGRTFACLREMHLWYIVSA